MKKKNYRRLITVIVIFVFAYVHSPDWTGVFKFDGTYTVEVEKT